MAGMTTYTDTDDSYAAGFSTARDQAFGLDDATLARVVVKLRAYLDADSTNRFALAYAKGALDALAPHMLYAEVA